MTKSYIHSPVGDTEIESLVPLTRAEEKNFFQRNPHLVQPYRSRLIGACLCQGAAIQYLGRGSGVNDFDIHFFYRQNEAKHRLSRAGKHILTTVGRFHNIRLDFYRTVIPAPLCASVQNPVEIIRAFLLHPLTDNAWHLAQKAVIGVWPKALLGVVIWPF